MNAPAVVALLVQLEPPVRDLIVAIIEAINNGDGERAQELAADAARLRGQASGMAAYRAGKHAGKQ